jgi:cytochrome c biogenesis protein CcmG/thiol:disulfide interchange protein DsbE
MSAAAHRRGARLAAASIALAAGCAPGMPPSVRHPLAGARAPELAETSIASESVSVPGDDETRATVVDFFASWCGACRVTMPALDALWRERQNDGLMVIGVSEDDDETTARRTARAVGASFPVVLDRGQDLAASYHVGQLPLTFVIDRAGVVRWVGHDPAMARRAVFALLRR